MAERRRVNVGFMGTQVLSLKISDERLTALRAALRDGQGWHEVETEDGPVMLNLNAVLFLRVDAADQRVGF